jgi:hypothetical protein
MLRIFLLSAVAVACLGFVIGCGDTHTSAPKPETSEPADHHHAQKGAHGGHIESIGQDNYHGEVIFEPDGGVDLYILGKDEGRVQEVEKQSLPATVKAEGDKSAEIEFQPAPQMDDAEGKTSRFHATLPEDLRGKALTLTVPSIRFSDGRFRFSTEYHPDHSENLPAKVGGSEEEQLYLIPGGKYTADDIQANGHLTASQKFKGFNPANHDKPHAGDPTCPVTDNKASPKFTWIIGGKKYEFCCPPCVDDFVKEAKEHPENIRDPEDYVKK